MNIEKKYLHGLSAILLLDFAVTIFSAIIFLSADIVIIVMFPVERILLCCFAVSLIGGNVYYINIIIKKLSTGEIDEKIEATKERVETAYSKFLELGNRESVVIVRNKAGKGKT